MSADGTTERPATGQWFGAGVLRKEDPALLTGKGCFVDDIHLPNTLHAVFVRSPHGHARLSGLDPSAALALPGVHAVLAHADLPQSAQGKRLPLFVPNPVISQPLMPYVLAREEVSFVGEAVALVIADSRAIGEDAAALVAVDYEPLQAVGDCVAAIEPGSPTAHLDSASNIAGRFPIAFGDTDKAFASAAHVIATHFQIHRGGAFFIECRGAIAAYDAQKDAITLYVASQGPHTHKRGLLELFDFSDDQIRVITPDVGGGFGPKAGFYPEYAALCAAALKLHRPIKWIEDRRENFMATNQERDQHWDLDIAVEADGKIRGLARTARARDRRLYVARRGDAVDFGLHRSRPLRHPGLQARCRGGVHQQGHGHAGARRGPAARRVRDGKADGPGRARACPRPGRIAPPQSRPARADALPGRAHLPRRQARHL